MTREDIHEHREPGLRIWSRPGVAPSEVKALLSEGGEPMKTSHKSVTWRKGGYVVKQSPPGAWLEAAKLTAQRSRCRRAWDAALHLHAHGGLAPEPLAYLERRRFGLVTGNALVSRYLEGCVNVEEQARRLAAEGASEDAVHAYLRAIADTVNAVSACGAVHHDLSGKNIFTAGGARFYVIDLDAVRLGARYRDADRLHNHVQLYDSFCDLWDARLLAPFILAMTPPRLAGGAWLEAVREGQRRRRARALALRAQRAR